MGKLKIERWKLRHKLSILVNLDNEFTHIFRIWYYEMSYKNNCKIYF